MSVELRCWLDILKTRLQLSVINYTILGHYSLAPAWAMRSYRRTCQIRQLWEQVFAVWRFRSA